MAEVPRIVPISDLRRDAAAVMLSLEAYRAAEDDRELLISLARGEREIKEGKGHSLKSVLDEADEILGKGQQ
jgi:hypothetical protein